MEVRNCGDIVVGDTPLRIMFTEHGRHDHRDLIRPSVLLITAEHQRLHDKLSSLETKDSKAASSYPARDFCARGPYYRSWHPPGSWFPFFSNVHRLHSMSAGGETTIFKKKEGWVNTIGKTCQRRVPRLACCASVKLVR